MPIDRIWTVLSALLYFFNIGLAVYIGIHLVYKKRDPVVTLSWIIVLLSLPYLGLLLYFTLGQNLRNTYRFSRKGKREKREKRHRAQAQIRFFNQPQNQPQGQSVPPCLDRQRKLILLNLNNAKNLLTAHNTVDLYFTGHQALDAMYQAAQAARRYLFLQSYIIEDDAIGNRWKQLLLIKAAQGVKVQVIYDAVGSWHLPRKFIRDLRRGGVDIHEFLPVRLPWFGSKVSNRNHRKLLVVDDRVAFMGGVNIADRYFDGGSFLQWTDTHIRITGEAVRPVRDCFLMDWQFVKKRRRVDRSLFEGLADDFPPATCYMQILSSGPDTAWAEIKQSFLTAIHQAKQSICVVTPYFVPDESLLGALRIAALGGVNVRILLPEKSDSRLTHWASLSYISELLAAQVKVYLYRAGFIHSKVISIDGDFCFIGSANFDNRSFDHNFEVGAMIYNPEVARQIEKKFNQDLVRSRRIHPRLWRSRSRAQRVGEALGRLLSPLL